MAGSWARAAHLGRHCIFCGDPAEAPTWCDACYRALPWNDAACIRCAAPLACVDSDVCGECLHAPPPFDAALCAFQYRFPINRLLVKLKFNARLGHGRALGALLADRVGRQGSERLPDVIIPAPLHPARVRQRGFNQASEIARVVGKRLGVPVKGGICERRRDTAPQSSLSAIRRRRNVRGAFSVRGRVPARHIAIVDDVVTTGATAGDLARALRAAGAENIVLWAAAKA